MSGVPDSIIYSECDSDDDSVDGDQDGGRGEPIAHAESDYLQLAADDDLSAVDQVPPTHPPPSSWRRPALLGSSQCARATVQFTMLAGMGEVGPLDDDVSAKELNAEL